MSNSKLVQAANTPADTSIHAFNSVTGSNVMGKGGMSNDRGTQIGNSLFHANLFNAGGMNGQPIGGGVSGPAGPASLPSLGISPTYYDPNSFGGTPNLGAGPFNSMAASMAGPMYIPRALPPTQAASPGNNMAPLLAYLKNAGSAGPTRTTLPY